MRTNRIQTALSEGRAAIGGLMMEFGTRGIAKVYEYADVDYVQIDMEHSAFGIERVADLIAWFKATEIASLVRVPQNLYHFLAGVLDAGASAVQVADVETVEQARAIVDAAKYPPLGHRGLGLTAAHSDFRSPKASDFMAEANARTMIFVGIESPQGVANAEAIASIDGIDALAVGLSDLSSSLGVHGQPDHPKLKEALLTVTQACKRTGKAGKTAPSSDAKAREYFEMGFNVLTLKSDIVTMRDGTKSQADNMRAALAGANSAR
jgi:2-keto-3-deoxy-L-rhamnonate aldolase RhmA